MPHTNDPVVQFSQDVHGSGLAPMRGPHASGLLMGLNLQEKGSNMYDFTEEEAWEVYQEEPVKPCPKCDGGTVRIVDECSGYPGEYFTVWECDACGYKEMEQEPLYDGLCENCGEQRPITDADSSGVKYGQCRKCHGLIADVWNPAPDVFKV